ncbi:hypothetical protein TraAM80_06545 [Trypanosoma rangeli]|uniref:Uncharacterized protein n=1 Tax=Trypanosoma rangeli TaxID=5698 RepID=A0A422N9X8_TRYRA|nr:uncharacterized protein TraAM80_06545 [Trypanosoma rangeli]RNF02251.1 hypothetical protein TraAM80_06545 [Trypanosoma rangeli]|eukprot:RNF02251.1 hypothetical protein TraAM80_06545 [Trypanosoma rangeli]
MSSGKTVVVHSSVRLDEEEEELCNAAVAVLSATAEGPRLPQPPAGDADDDDDFSIAYVEQKGAPVSLASARSVPLKRSRGSPVGPTDVSVDAEAVEGMPDDTDHPNDRVAYARWQARDAARPKELLLG